MSDHKKGQMAKNVDEATLEDAVEMMQETEEVQERLREDAVVQLEQQLAVAREEKRMALADYQNLVRRTQEDRVRLVQMAGQDMAEALITPLRNLNLAAATLNDKGLNMVVEQFWQTLGEQGLEELNGDLIGQEFDVEIMEAIEKTGDGEKVVKVVSPGYKMNGKVIEHAKVVVG